MSINFAHIAPVSHLHRVSEYPVHLLLAHLIEDNEGYRNFYINLKKENPNVFYHMDCSTFEMFKRGESMYPSERLVDLGKAVGADSIVMSDYPKQHWSKTVEAAHNLIPVFKREGFKTFFCPQSDLGDLEGLMRSYQWAVDHVDIDFIGVSILACPIALGVNETKHGDGARDDSYRMQRFLSRWKIFEELKRRGMLDDKTTKRFHCLGMTDGPREIDLLRQYRQYIFSWDSSSAVWLGINGRVYDNSPTGLRAGKLETEVDFDAPHHQVYDDLIISNMNVIDQMCGQQT